MICLHRSLPFNLVIVLDMSPKHGVAQIEICRKDPRYSTDKYPLVSGRTLLLRLDSWGKPWHAGIDVSKHAGWAVWWWRFMVEYC